MGVADPGPVVVAIRELGAIKLVAERGICSWRWSGWRRTELGQMLWRKGCFPPHSPLCILSTEPSFALAPAPGPEEMSAAGAHSCSPCSIYCFQFNVPGSWAGQHGGNMVMLSCAKPAWKKILPSRLGWMPFPSLQVKPARGSLEWPCGVGPGRGAGPATISLCSLDAELGAGLAWPGRARRWNLGARGSF